MVTAPAFTGKYASIRKDIWKGTLGTKYDPTKTSYKTERGYYNAQQKEFNELMAKIDKIERASLPTQGSIYIDWKKGSMGAMQAKAELSYSFTDASGNHNRHIEGTRTGGVGYDKESSASANVFNESPEFMRILMDARAKKKKLPYGVSLNIGRPYLPHWDWGVGIECHNMVLRESGYDVQYIRPGVYTYTLKRRRA